jgi:hypothetical protein
MFIAKLIAPDGFEDRKQFSTRQAAMNWLTGEGAKNFDGDIDRGELWENGELVWIKADPKPREKVYVFSRANEDYRESRKALKEELKRWRKYPPHKPLK